MTTTLKFIRLDDNEQFDVVHEDLGPAKGQPGFYKSKWTWDVREMTISYKAPPGELTVHDRLAYELRVLVRECGMLCIDKTCLDMAAFPAR